MIDALVALEKVVLGLSGYRIVSLSEDQNGSGGEALVVGVYRDAVYLQDVAVVGLCLRRFVYGHLASGG